MIIILDFKTVRKSVTKTEKVRAAQGSIEGRGAPVGENRLQSRLRDPIASGIGCGAFFPRCAIAVREWHRFFPVRTSHENTHMTRVLTPLQSLPMVRKRTVDFG